MTEVMDRPAAAPANTNGGGNQLAKVDADRATQLAQRPPAPVNPAFQSRGIVLTSFDEAWRMANAIAKSGMAPRGMDSPEALFVAIEMGMEVGLAPMASIRSIAVINGRPAIYGDAALALVRASGLLESFEERIEGDGENRCAVCVAKRKGMPKPRVTPFSVADARKAGIWGKTGPWSQYPERMLQFRARGFCLRDEFGDVLQGMVTYEEAADIGPVVVTDAPQRGVAGLLQRVKAPPLDSGQTFDPTTGQVDEPDHGAGVSTNSAPRDAAGEPDAPAPSDSPEPDVSGADVEDPAIDAYDKWYAGVRDLATQKGMTEEQFKSAMTRVALGNKVKGKEWELPTKARSAVVKAIEERSGHFA